MKVVGNGVYLLTLGFLLYQANSYMELGQPVPETIWRPLGYLAAVGVLVVAVMFWIGPPPKGITPRVDRSTVSGALLMLWTIVALYMTSLIG
jgi:hypothetical protein